MLSVINVEKESFLFFPFSFLSLFLSILATDFLKSPGGENVRVSRPRGARLEIGATGGICGSDWRKRKKNSHVCVGEKKVKQEYQRLATNKRTFFLSFFLCVYIYIYIMYIVSD